MPTDDQIRNRKSVEARVTTRAARDDQFRADLLDHPQRVLAEQYGLTLSAGTTVRIVEENDDEFVLVVPARSHAEEPRAEDRELDLDDLDQAAGGSRSGGGDDGEEW